MATIKEMNISFDISSELSLDKLRDDLLVRLKNEQSTAIFDIRGAGGGNTGVHVYAADEQDFEAIQNFMVAHKHSFNRMNPTTKQWEHIDLEP